MEQLGEFIVHHVVFHLPGNKGFGGLTVEQLGEGFIVFRLPGNVGFGKQWNSWEKGSLCTMLCL